MSEHIPADNLLVLGDFSFESRLLLGTGKYATYPLMHDALELSGCECQLVAVVRALINQPSIILADEPTGALDHSNAESLAELLVELNRGDRVTLIVVTHSVKLASQMGAKRQLKNGTFASADA